MASRVFALLALVLFAATPALAVQPDEVLSDAALEARARALSAGLRCLVCQNQSIDDSNAPLARDLRLLVRERLTAGDSDEEVRDFVVARYGEFVLLRPPFSWSTVILWLTPVILIVAALGFAVHNFRAARTKDAQSALTAEEEAKLKAALAKADHET
jgi:cytochrome c-type biogenesis protein CcmH